MDIYQTNLFDITKDEYFSPKSLITYISICQEVFVYTVLEILRTLFKYPRRGWQSQGIQTTIDTHFP